MPLLTRITDVALEQGTEFSLIQKGMREKKACRFDATQTAI